MNDLPKISVLMSVYNGAEFLKESVDSILNQTFSDFEFLIINDASTDQTAGILNSYSDLRLKIITNSKNLGLTKSLNIGLKQARGVYIARMDSDDISLLNRLQAQYDFMVQNPDIALVGSQVEKIDQAGVFIGYKKSRPLDPNIIKFWLLARNPLVHPTIFFRRQAVIDVGGYNENYIYAQDFELYSRLVKKYKIANLPIPLIKFRYHNQSITRTASKRIIQLNCALSIITDNINRYLPINQRDVADFIKTINDKNSGLMSIFKSLRIYKKLIATFIQKEGLNAKSAKRLRSMYKLEKHALLSSYLKNIFKIVNS